MDQIVDLAHHALATLIILGFLAAMINLGRDP